MSHQTSSEMEMPRIQKVKVFAEPESSVFVSSKKISLGNFLSSWISVRYAVIRMLTCPVPCLPTKIPYIGGKSLIEIIALLVTFAITINFSLKTSSSAGYVADYLGGLLVLCGMRNSILTVLFGVSFERALFFHKFVALAMVAAMTIHGIGEGLNDTGLVLIILICATILIYVAKIKNYSFELFYYVHVLCYLAIIPVAFLHSATYFPIAGAVWACDLLLRYLITLKKVTAEATVLPGNVVKIQFPKMFSYQPGQYCFLMVKSLSQVEYHPISISSSPLQDTTTFHIRALGDWTNKLQSSVLKRIEDQKAEEQKRTTGGGDNKKSNFVPLEMSIEGPFGVPMINFDDHNYTVFLFISGGIGITPLQGMYNHLILEQQNGRNIRKAIFVWSVRDKAVATSIDPDILIPDLEKTNRNTLLPLSFQPPMAPPPTVYATQHMDNMRGSDVTSLEDGGDQHIEMAATTTAAESDAATAAVDTTDIGLESALVFHTEYYLTQVRNKEELSKGYMYSDHKEYLRFGRPDLSKLFADTANMCLTENIQRVAVFVCGPESMVHDVSDLAKATHIGCNNKVKFDCHAELFTF